MLTIDPKFQNRHIHPKKSLLQYNPFLQYGFHSEKIYTVHHDQQILFEDSQFYFKQRDIKIEHEFQSRESNRSPRDVDRRLLCCRAFFLENQIIGEPESQIWQFKSYSFPFSKQKNLIIQKTVCGFLNANGGYIFIGIEQNCSTKEHKVVGGTYTESQKQQIHKLMRRNASNIQPDIIINIKYKVYFVPVKAEKYPYEYLLGRYVIKIKVLAGLRDQIYTLKMDHNYMMVCLRMENQVLCYDPKKQMRKILEAQKQRALYPLNLPTKLHYFECRKPELGRRLFSRQNRLISKNRYHKIKFQQYYNTQHNQSDDVKDTSKPQLQNQINTQSSKSSIKSRGKKKCLYENSLIKIQHHDIQKITVMETKKNIPNKIKTRSKKKQDDDDQYLPLKSDIINVQQPLINTVPQIKCNNESSQILSLLNQQQAEQKPTDHELQNNTNDRKEVSNEQPYKKQVINLGNKKIKKIYERAENCKTNDIKIRRIGKEKQQQYFIRYISNMTEYTQPQIRNLITQLTSITTSFHKFYLFSGFLHPDIQSIMQEFPNVINYTHYQLQTQFLYKFTRETNDNLLKLLMTKAIQNDKYIENSMSTCSDQTNNSNNEQNLNQCLIIKINRNQSDGFNTKDINNNMKQLERMTSLEEKRGSKLVCKLSTKVKILRYNKLDQQTKILIQEKVAYIEKMIPKRMDICNQFNDKTKEEVTKNKQLEFGNLFYSLLGFLQLKKLNCSLVFCSVEQQ